MELTQNHVQRQVVLVVLNLHEGNTLQGWKVHGTGSGFYPIQDFGINGVAHLGSAFRGLVLLLNVVTSYPKLLTYIIPLGLDYF